MLTLTLNRNPKP